MNASTMTMRRDADGSSSRGQSIPFDEESSFTSSTKGAPRRQEEPNADLRKQQHRLLKLYHAAHCNHEHLFTTTLLNNSTGDQCAPVSVPPPSCPDEIYCCASKRLFQHMITCTVECSVPGCKKSRNIWKHYRKCIDDDCPLCRVVPTKYNTKALATRYKKVPTTPSRTPVRNTASTGGITKSSMGMSSIYKESPSKSRAGNRSMVSSVIGSPSTSKNPARRPRSSPERSVSSDVAVSSTMGLNGGGKSSATTSEKENASVLSSSTKGSNGVSRLTMKSSHSVHSTLRRRFERRRAKNIVAETKQALSSHDSPQNNHHQLQQREASSQRKEQAQQNHQEPAAQQKQPSNHRFNTSASNSSQKSDSQAYTKMKMKMKAKSPSPPHHDPIYHSPKKQPDAPSLDGSSGFLSDASSQPTCSQPRSSSSNNYHKNQETRTKKKKAQYPQPMYHSPKKSDAPSLDGFSSDGGNTTPTPYSNHRRRPPLSPRKTTWSLN